MPILKNYRHFDGLHYETGTIHNVLAYQGVTAPHTGKPYSEALLLGVSGGIAFGYFTFEYKGYDPHVSLLTRNTFDPMPAILERLAIPQTVLQTDNLEKGEANLVEVLEGGQPAIVWADSFSLPYNARLGGDESWGMLPVVVYGHDGETVYIADGSRKPLHVPAGDFARARARVKKDKFRIIALDAPDPRKLPSAVQKGIWQCIQLYTEAPPKGGRNNFGFAALKHWANMLTNTRNKQSWARYFPPGRRMFAALAGYGGHPGVYGWICHWGFGQGAERKAYAGFLDEAAIILNKPKLRSAADLFRASSEVWCELANVALPDRVPLLKETRDLLNRRHSLFIEKGDEGLKDIRRINDRLGQIRNEATENFPLVENEAAALRQRMSEHVLRIHNLEYEAVEAMQAAVA